MKKMTEEFMRPTIAFFIALSPVLTLLFIIGCTLSPTPLTSTDMESSSRRIGESVSSRYEAIHRLNDVLRYAKIERYRGNTKTYCTNFRATNTEISYDCRRSETYYDSKGYARVRTAGRWPETQTYCDWEFNASRLPLMDYTYYVGSISFGSNKEAAIDAYHLMDYLCKH